MRKTFLLLAFGALSYLSQAQTESIVLEEHFESQPENWEIVSHEQSGWVFKNEAIIKKTYNANKVKNTLTTPLINCDYENLKLSFKVCKKDQWMNLQNPVIFYVITLDNQVIKLAELQNDITFNYVSKEYSLKQFKDQKIKIRIEHENDKCTQASIAFKDFIVSGIKVEDYKWLGHTASMTEPLNYLGKQIPDEKSEVIIYDQFEGNIFPELSENLTINKIEIKSGAILTLKNGAILGVHQEIVNNGTIIFINEDGKKAAINGSYSASSTGDIKVISSYKPNIFYKEGLFLNEVNKESFQIADRVNHRYYKYADKWIELNTSDNINQFFGASFNHIHKNETNIEYKGSLENEQVKISPQVTGWQMFSNPFISEINLLNPITANQNHFDAVEKKIYREIRNGDVFMYLPCDLTSPDVNDNRTKTNLKPGEMFWGYVVKQQQIILDPILMVKPNSTLKSCQLKTEKEYAILRLYLQNDYCKNSVCFKIGKDIEINNVPKSIQVDNRVPEIYTKIDGKPYGISCYDLNGDFTIPIYLNLPNEAVSNMRCIIEWENENLTEYEIILKDKGYAKDRNLRIATGFRWKGIPLNDKHCYDIVFKKIATSVPELEKINKTKVFANRNEIKIILRDENEKPLATVYDLNGRKIINRSCSNKIETIRIVSGFYLVEMKYSNKVENFKVLVN